MYLFIYLKSAKMYSTMMYKYFTNVYIFYIYLFTYIYIYIY